MENQSVTQGLQLTREKSRYSQVIKRSFTPLTTHYSLLPDPKKPTLQSKRITVYEFLLRYLYHKQLANTSV